MAQTSKRQQAATQQPSSRSEHYDIPMDSDVAKRERPHLNDLEGRRQDLSPAEEMVRRNQRSHDMRLKNRIRARR